MVKNKIQEEGLRTYLFTYGFVYDSIALSDLSAMFGMSPQKVHSTVSKMMINEELHASWDQPTSSIVMHRAELSRVQLLSQQLADKV